MDRVESLAELLELRALEDPGWPLFTFLSDDGETEGVRTTAELAVRARAGAVRIRETCEPGDRALLLAPPGLDYIDAFYACAAAGAYAVPAYPPDPLRLSRTVPRLAAIVRDAGPRVILTTSLLRSLADPVVELAPELREIPWVAMDEIEPSLAAGYVRPPFARDQTAYLQYTSGSTADPRGVIVTNENVLHHVPEIVRVTERSPGCIIVSWMPPYHDFGLLGSIVMPLFAGGRSVLTSPLAFLRSPLAWLRALSVHRGQATQAATFALELCLRKIDPEACGDIDLSSVELIAIGGEPIRPDTVRRFEDRFARLGLRRGTMTPGWGLAEATLVLTGRAPGPLLVRNLRASALRRGRVVEVSAASTDSFEIAGCGPVFPSTEVVAVDRETQTPCPPGQVGELWARGPGICPGYWQRPDETRDPFANHLADGRGPYLRTGDLGFLDGGEVFITGRMKDVIIIRGQNHYPQDIERSVEQSHPALRPGCVAAFAVEVAGAERLCIAAEVRTREDLDPAAVADGIRAAVARDHEVQAHTVVLLPLGGLPKTSSGKVQRQPCKRQLLDGTLEVLARIEPSRVAASGAGEAAVTPADDLDDTVLAWLVTRFAETLELGEADVAVDRPIAALGVDSLAAMSLVQAVEDRFACSIPVSSFFEEMTLRDLAGLVTSARRTGERAWTGLIPAHGDPQYPLSHGQRGLWFLTRLAPASAAYNLAHAASIRGPLDAGALERAFRRVLERHEALRCTFHGGAGGEPVQRVEPQAKGFFAERSVAGARDEEIAAVVDELAAAPFDLEARAPFRVVLLERAPDEHVLVVVTHHLVADFWSLAVVNRELRILYEAERSGAAATLPEPSWQHRDQVRAERELLASSRADRLLRYWDEQLVGDLPVLELPTDRPRPVVQGFRGGLVRTVLDPGLAERVRCCASAAATTPFVVLLAAFQSLLHRHSRQPEVIVGSPLSGRGRREWTDVVGYFANPVPLRATFAGDPSFRDLLARIRMAVLGALDHQDVAFPVLVERRNPPRDASRSPIFQAMFTYPQAPEGWVEGGLMPLAPGPGARTSLGELSLEAWPKVERGGAQLDLSLMAIEHAGAVELVWEYDSALFDVATIERLAAHYATLLAAGVEQTSTPVSELPLLDEDERSFVVEACNATARELPDDALVHRLIAAQAARTPDAPAVRSAEGWITAGELDLRAACLARRLRDAGVAPGARVGVLLERSPDLVVALLGVLRAGAAYVPLDAAHPIERLRAMIEDAGAAPLLVDAASEALAGELGARILRVDAARADGGDPPGEARVDAGPVDEVSGDDLAYVIYTSGSTGKPKGVEVTHRALANLLVAMREVPGLGPGDTLLAVTTVSFDIAALEIFLPLVAGGRLVLASREEATDGRALGRALHDSGATVMQATPASWRMLIGAGWEGSPGFKALCGGDVLPRELADALLARAASVWNLYGPTETTIWSAVAQVGPGDGPVPVGHPIANTQLHVLDERLDPLPLGVPGELYIGGLGLARGYVGLPDLTRERFVAAPARLGGRLYRTGDLARRRADGAIEVLGRNDRQVKLRGFRVELGEVEAAVVLHPEVADCAVVTVGAGDARRLAAYVVMRANPGSIEGLRAFLLERLPHYMVPSFLVPLERLPLTHAGKIDRTRLPDPERGEARAGERVAPRSDRERLVLEIWRQVLQVADCGVEDDFFSLGGDSLRAAELAARISRATGCELGVRDLLAHPTVAAVASRVGETAGDQRIDPAPAAPQLAPAPAPLVAPAFVEIERRPLLTLLAAGKLAPVDAAAIAYLPASLPQSLGVTREVIVEEWFGGLPLFAGVLSTTLGRVGLILLPHFDDDLYQGLPELRASLHDGMEIARQIGAQVVSLTGLLPAVTGQGHDLLGTAPEAGADWGEPAMLPAVTTGHATTAATVVLSVARILADSRRDLAQETLAILGVGSVGLAALRLLLRCLPEPERILLCDLYRKRDHLGAIRRELIESFGVTARIDTLETRDRVPADLYDASLVVGATNVGGVLDVARLRPGTLIVDDSAPHCFNRGEAEARFRERGDLLFTEGGVLKAPEPIPRLLYLPRGAERLARLLPGGLPGMPGVVRPDEITGCVLSSLLSTRYADLPPTTGEVAAEASLLHYERLCALGFSGAELHCEGFTLAPEGVARFREHVTASPGASPGR